MVSYQYNIRPANWGWSQTYVSHLLTMGVLINIFLVCWQGGVSYLLLRKTCLSMKTLSSLLDEEAQFLILFCPT